MLSNTFPSNNAAPRPHCLLSETNSHRKAQPRFAKGKHEGSQVPRLFIVEGCEDKKKQTVYH